MTYYDTYCLAIGVKKGERGATMQVVVIKKGDKMRLILSDVFRSKIAGNSNHLICPLYLVVNDVSS